MQVFEAMKAIVEQPGYPLLRHYRNDVYVHDRRFMENFCADNTAYLWEVRECGSHLVRIGVHPRHSEWMEAVLRNRANSGEAAQLYHIAVMQMEDSPRIAPIDPERAASLLKRHEYEVADGHIRRLSGQAIASIDTQVLWRMGKSCASVTISTAGDLTRRDITAMALIAQSEVTVNSGTLFTTLDNLVIDGKEWNEVAERLAA